MDDLTERLSLLVMRLYGLHEKEGGNTVAEARAEIERLRKACDS